MDEKAIRLTSCGGLAIPPRPKRDASRSSRTLRWDAVDAAASGAIVLESAPQLFVHFTGRLALPKILGRERASAASHDQTVPFPFWWCEQQWRFVAAANLTFHFIDLPSRAMDIAISVNRHSDMSRMRSSQPPAVGIARNCVTRRCFSAATGVCR